MSMLVLIRNIEEMDTALEAANKYVIFMQKLFDSNQQEKRTFDGAFSLRVADAYLALLWGSPSAPLQAGGAPCFVGNI